MSLIKWVTQTLGSQISSYFNDFLRLLKNVQICESFSDDSFCVHEKNI